MDTLFVGLRVVLSLGVVLALLYVLQKRIVTGGRSGRQTSQVTVVARQGIGAKASVVVVDVEGERLVLGVTDASVTVLAASDRPVEPVALELVAGSSDAPPAAQEARVTPIAPLPSSAASSAPAFAAVLSAHAAPIAAPVAEPARASAADAPMLRPRGAARRATVVRERAPRDVAARRRGRTAEALDGSILSPGTWRQAAAALRSGRAG